MQTTVQEKEKSSGIVQWLRQATAHVSMVAMVGVSVVGIAIPVIVHAQGNDPGQGGDKSTSYVPSIYLDYIASVEANRGIDKTGWANWESASLNYLQMHLPERGQAGVAGSTYPEALISPYQASQVASGSGQGVVAGSPISGSEYFPYVDSAHAGTWSAQGKQQIGSAVVAAPATPIASVDVMRHVYADSQTPIEQQAYQNGSAGAVVAAPATPIASVDVMRYVYADSQTPIEQQVHQQAVLARQRAVMADVLRGPYQYERADAAVAPAPASLARAVYGDENFLFWAPAASAIVESEPGPAQAFITPHRPGDAI